MTKANDHAIFHSATAFCGNAGPAELKHVSSLVDELTDDELAELVTTGGITFAGDSQPTRDDYEGVWDEIDREQFYKLYEQILSRR